MATANMGMVLPIPGVTQALGIALPGESWMELQNAAALVLDAHNHTAGMGAPLPSEALLVDFDVDWHGFNIIGLRSTRYTAQAGVFSLAADVGAVYVVGNELWYRDFAGDNVQITDNGSVVGPAGSITGLVAPASAAYAAGAFTWKSDVAAYASMINGSVRIYDQVGAGKYAQITAAPAAGVDYTLTLPPAPPSVTRIITMDAGGALTAKYNVDEATISIAGNTFHVPTSGIGALQLATNAVIEAKIGGLAVTETKIGSGAVTEGKLGTGAVTATKLGSLAVETAKINDLAVTNAKIAAETIGMEKFAPFTGDNHNTSGASYSNVTASYTQIVAGGMTTTGLGRPVLVIAAPTSENALSTLNVTGEDGYFRLMRDGTATPMGEIRVGIGSYPTLSFVCFQPDLGVPTSYVWRLQARTASGAGSIDASYMQILCFEL